MLFITCRLPDNTCAKAPHAQKLLDVNNEQAVTLLKHDGAGGTSIFIIARRTDTAQTANCDIDF